MRHQDHIAEHTRILWQHPEIAVHSRWGSPIEYSIRITRTDAERLMQKSAPERTDMLFRLTVGSEWTEKNTFVRHYAKVEYRVGTTPWREPLDTSLHPPFTIAERFLRSKHPALLDLMEHDIVIQKHM